MAVPTEIILTLLILLGSLVLFITGRMRMDLVALLVLLALALSGLVTPAQAVAGFSHPAVITVCAIFVLSGGLQKTGVANLVGRFVLSLAGSSEARMILAIMLTAGAISFIMNSVAITALLLPVVMDIARRTGIPPSKLLMPLSFGSLLGGLTTAVGTLPNILVSNTLRDHGFRPFGLFDFAPVGLAAAGTGILFMVLIGRHLLPARDLKRETSHHLDLKGYYGLHERMFVLRIPRGSELAGRTLAETRLGSTLGLHVVAIFERGELRLAPSPNARVRAGDRLLVQGTPDQLTELEGWRQLVIEPGGPELEWKFPAESAFAEVEISPGSQVAGQTLPWLDFRKRFGVNVVAIRRGGLTRRTNLQEWRLRSEDVLLLHGVGGRLAAFKEMAGFSSFRPVSAEELRNTYQLDERLFFVRISEESRLAGKTLNESRLGDALGLTVLGIFRGDSKPLAPEPESRLEAGDRLVVEGKSEDLSLLKGLQELQIERELVPQFSEVESDQVGLMEAVLSPRSNLIGKTLRQLHFRDRYGLTVLGIWRQGQALPGPLRDVSLQFGDALLLYGPREKLRLLGREPDFVVLTEAMQEPPRYRQAPLAVAGLALFIIPVLLGWLPIYLAALLSAVAMVLTGCLRMDEAYESVDWKSVILIAGMLPLGTALVESGGSQLVAGQIIGWAGHLGPRSVIALLFVITSLGATIIPASAVVVLLAPMAMTLAEEMGFSPYALMMTLGLAAAGSFNSPVSHPSNVMIMGPGGYRFVDYLKVGIPLSFLVLVVVVVFLPIFWPVLPQ